MASIDLMDRTNLFNVLYQQLVLDPSDTAVVALDLTERLLGPDRTALPAAEREWLITNSQRFLALARARGFPVIHVVTAHRPVERNLIRWNAEVAAAGLSVSPYGEVDLTIPDYQEARWQADILPELRAETDYVIRNKKAYSAFHGTDLFYLLRALGTTKRIVLIGLNSNTDIQATEADAIDGHAIDVIVIPECVGSVFGTDLNALAIEHHSRCLGWGISIEQFQAKLDHQDGKLAELPQLAPLGQRSVELLDRSAFVETMKARLALDPKRTAVIQIDMHRRQIDPTWAPFPSRLGDPVLERTSKFLERCRAYGLPVIQIMVHRRPVEDQQYNRYKETAKCGEYRSPYGPDLPYDCGMAEGEFTWDIMPILGPAEGDYIINSKKSGSCYHHTDLESLLRTLGVDTLVITGINTNTCDTKCALDSANRGIRPILIADCVDSSYGPDMHAWALENIARSIGWVLTADEFEQKLREGLGLAEASPTPVEAGAR